MHPNTPENPDPDAAANSAASQPAGSGQPQDDTADRTLGGVGNHYTVGGGQPPYGQMPPGPYGNPYGNYPQPVWVPMVPVGPVYPSRQPYGIPRFNPEPSKPSRAPFGMGLASLLCGIAALGFPWVCTSIPLGITAFGLGIGSVVAGQKGNPSVLGKIGMPFAGVGMILSVILTLVYAAHH